ncbi:hypothetical protein [Spirillospora sp. CA-128828]|uniref:hypothetical protein n=1 Tax=Spirillospora sp. CA-128828 TaxID=3240033 RepID=UPI003D8D54DC
MVFALSATLALGVILAAHGGQTKSSPYSQGWSWAKTHTGKVNDPQACIIEQNNRFGASAAGIDFYIGCQNALDGLRYDPSGKEVFTPGPRNSGFGLDP